MEHIDFAQSNCPECLRDAHAISRAREIAECSRKLKKLSLGLSSPFDVATLCDDPRHWDFLMKSSQSGDRHAFRVLLEDFFDVLEVIYSRVLPGHLVRHATLDTLRSAADKLNTCDPDRSIISWLFAIAVYRVARPRELALQ